MQRLECGHCWVQLRRVGHLSCCDVPASHYDENGAVLGKLSIHSGAGNARLARLGMSHLLLLDPIALYKAKYVDVHPEPHDSIYELQRRLETLNWHR